MAITTTPTAAMKTAIANAFTSEFGGSPPTSTAAIAAAMAEVIAVAIEQALTEVKTNAEVPSGTSGSDTLDVD